MAAKSKPKDRSDTETNSKSKQSRTVVATPGLWLVSTPIGNARDITLRALDALAEADILACEDTRVTKKLLTIHGIQAKSVLSYHDHNAAKIGPKLIDALQDGRSVALVSDAGTPMINDPGFRLVEAAIAAGISVTSLPGPSAVLTGLQLSGLPSDRFLYLGFPAPKSKARKDQFQAVARVEATLVFLESPKRLAATLSDMASILGDRPAAVTRELTKAFEEVRRDSLVNLANHYSTEGPPKGEITLIVGGSDQEEGSEVSDAEIDRMLRTQLESLSMRDAVDAVTGLTALPRKTVYARALAIKNASEGRNGAKED